MEEKAVGGKEKKYVLYTVVNDDKSRAGVGVWVVRILLGSLLLVALAVVPYVSLRLAQANDRTLVVFQPVPVHNHSRIHHHKFTSHRPGVYSPHIQSDSLVKENYTTEPPIVKKRGNATLVMLHESAVTLSLLEESSNMTHSVKNQTSDIAPDVSETTISDVVTMAINSTSASTVNPKDDVVVLKKDVSSQKPETESIVNKDSSVGQTTPAGDYSKSISTDVSTKFVNIDLKPTSLPQEEKNVSINKSGEIAEHHKSILLQILKSSSSVTTSNLSSTLSSSYSSSTSTTTSSPKPVSVISSSMPDIIHKLAYVATASSGNHVGGICVWKTNKNITKWSYFYDNIPIEYQSHQDSTDHEMRALLVAVRLWQDQWHDYHVVLRSQHQAVEGSKHLTRVQLGKELEKLSDKHFTYEPEWRQRKDDSLMEIAYCLARLHKDYEYWFNKFEQNVDEMLGAQDWSKAQEEKRHIVPQSLFFTDQKPKQETKSGDLTSLSMN